MTFSQRVEKSNTALCRLREEITTSGVSSDMVLKLMVSNIDSIINFNISQHDLFLRIQDKDGIFGDLMKRFLQESKNM
jgi:hypothetical protein